MKFATKAIHEGYVADPLTGAIMPPIYMTSTFVQEAPGQTKGYDYTRSNNPNFTILEKIIASLEVAQHATVFSSGLGALTAMCGMLSQGDRVVAIEGMYGGTYRLFNSVFNRFGIQFEQIKEPRVDLLENVLASKPKWLLFETPTNPLLDVYDIEVCAKVAKRHGVTVVIDNTFATPYSQNPLSLGTDMVWHSTTKYMGGHSDVIGGVVATNNSLFKEKLDFMRLAMGLNPSPFDTWLVTRGIKTLALRMEKHQQNALLIAQYLERHPKVAKVYYPGLTSHPHHLIAKKQMRGFGGIVSAEFNLSLALSKKLITSLKLFSLAESLGGVESLVCHPASMTHASIPSTERCRINLNDGLIRFSVGIEDASDLIDDLDLALQII